jgi:TolB-like protein
VEAPFDPGTREAPGNQPPPTPTYVNGTRPLLIALAVACLAALTVLLLNSNLTAGHPASIANTVPPRSVAVLAFLDLTSQAMSEEYFADGITEELIDKLSKMSALHVAPPTSSFYFKGKKLTVSEIATKLGVTYVLDGSVRKSGRRLRVAARLIRADNGYVIWSESYDRPFEDRLWVQDDIAGEVTKALQTAIEEAWMKRQLAKPQKAPVDEEGNPVLDSEGQPLGIDEDDPAGKFDDEDDPILLRLVQLKRGGLVPPTGDELTWQHVAVDEAQDRSALWLGVIGLVLLVAGWRISTYVPPSRYDDDLDAMRRAGDDGLRRKLDEYQQGWARPYQLPGRLLFFAGLGLFVIAGVKMYRAPVPAQPREPEHVAPARGEEWS